MRSSITSFSGLFELHGDDVPPVGRVEIPLIQRDYAQGRPGDSTKLIRNSFIDALHAAVTGGERLPLDFVYGEVTDGTFEPLDGQQRLTTLFLLHWYVAARTDRIHDQPWMRFNYATRPSAALFCKRLVAHSLPNDVGAPSDWIRDQPWCLYLWRHDPSIQSMLVMLDAIHDRFADDDLDSVWAQLTDPDKPAIYFHLLLIDDMGSAEDLYIKMNSRGKPLTEFENFKALLEKAIEGSPLAGEFAERADGPWADVMWRVRDANHLFDTQYLNYLRFIVELCEWRNEEASSSRLTLIARAGRAFASGEPSDDQNLAFLFAALDTWCEVDTNTYFAGLFATESTASDDTTRVVLFGNTATDVNLFRACCNSSFFGVQRSLLLYAVLVHRIDSTLDFPRRLRMLRNLLEASSNELRFEAMADHIADVERLVVTGDLTTVESFNTNQRDDEVAKREFLTVHPELEPALFRLEDHELLRGCVMAFELDPALEQRAPAFRAVFDDSAAIDRLRPALLTVGPYHRPFGSYKLRFGSPAQSAQWRDLLAGDAPSRQKLASSRSVLGTVLDAVAASDTPAAERLAEICDEWLADREAEQRFSWRYYLVKYPAMRKGASGVYASADGNAGFDLAMLEGTGLNGYYRDPFLYAVTVEADADDDVAGTIEDRPYGPWFTGSATVARRMRLHGTGVLIQCVPEGFAVALLTGEDHPAGFEAVAAAHGVVQTGDGYLLPTPQTTVGGEVVDSVDRVHMCAAFLRDLLNASL